MPQLVIYSSEIAREQNQNTRVMSELLDSWKELTLFVVIQFVVGSLILLRYKSKRKSKDPNQA